MQYVWQPHSIGNELNFDSSHLDVHLLLITHNLLPSLTVMAINNYQYSSQDQILDLSRPQKFGVEAPQSEGPASRTIFTGQTITATSSCKYLRCKEATDKLLNKVTEHEDWPMHNGILCPQHLTSCKPLWSDTPPLDVISPKRIGELIRIANHNATVHSMSTPGIFQWPC